MARPRAADDFPAIRARLEELRRERGDTQTDDRRTPDGPPPYAAGSIGPGLPGRSSGLSPMMRRALQRVRTA